ncbi:MAG TPA: MFS transporter [Nostocaceae cyanobacterium]|nr:MFS transporter [Nostocaceae cyanobacterium]
MNRKLWIVTLIAFINSLSVTILIPVIYIYGQQFSLNDFQISLLFSIYSVAQFFATPVIGKLSDRFGRKPLLIISLAGTVIANLIAGTATSAGLLFFGRFLDGITGGNMSVAQAVVSDITSPKDRAQAFSMFTAAMMSGFVLGPVTSLLAQQFSLGMAFLASGTVALIGLLLTIFFLPETLPSDINPSKNIFDLGLSNLIKGLVIPGVGILLLVNFLTGTTFTMFTFAFQPYFLNVLGQNKESLTILFLTFGVVGVIMQTLGVPFLNRKIDVVNILFLGLFFRSLSFCLMPVWPNIAYFVMVCILFSLFNSLVQPMISTLISLNARPEEQGMVMGLNASYLSISNGIGPIIAGLLVNRSQPITYSYPLYLAGILTFLVLAWAVYTRKKYTPKAQSI